MGSIGDIVTRWRPNWNVGQPGPRLNILKDVLSSDLVKSQSHETGTLNCHMASKFDRHMGSNAAEVPVKFQSDRTILNTNLVASRLETGVYQDKWHRPSSESERKLYENMLTTCSLMYIQIIFIAYNIKVFLITILTVWALLELRLCQK